MKQTKRKEVLTLVKPARTVHAIPIEQADAELRTVAIAFYLMGWASPFIVLPLLFSMICSLICN